MGDDTILMGDPFGIKNAMVQMLTEDYRKDAARVDREVRVTLSTQNQQNIYTWVAIILVVLLLLTCFIAGVVIRDGSFGTFVVFILLIVFMLGLGLWLMKKHKEGGISIRSPFIIADN